jgi:hypothetical protein
VVPVEVLLAGVVPRPAVFSHYGRPATRLAPSWFAGTAAALVTAVLVAGVVAPAGALTAAGGAVGADGRTATAAGSYGPDGGSSRGTDATDAGVVATATFRSTVGAAASSFTADVDALSQAVNAGDVPAARTDELAAQAQYDALRYLSGSGSATSSPVDERPGDVPSGAHLAGLHLVERDLWVGGDASAAVVPLVAAAPLMEVALERLQLSPHAIDLVADRELGWVTSVAVPGLEETFSHLDSVDVAATVSAARAAFDAVAPLGHLVAAGPTATAEARFATLAGAVQALGPPGTVPDHAIPDARWRSVAEDADATASVLSELAPALAGYGPRQIYGYNS